MYSFSRATCQCVARPRIVRLVKTNTGRCAPPPPVHRLFAPRTNNAALVKDSANKTSLMINIFTQAAVNRPTLEYVSIEEYYSAYRAFKNYQERLRADKQGFCPYAGKTRHDAVSSRIDKKK
jgi:hypothetical protein